MATNTFGGVLRSRNGGERGTVTPAVPVFALKVSGDPTAASAGTGKYLPSGAIPINVIGLGGATGGTNPTIDIGTAGSSAGFANELDCDATFTDAVQATTGGALLGVALTADTEVYLGVGASAATGGTATALIQFVMSDNGTEST